MIRTLKLAVCLALAAAVAAADGRGEGRRDRDHERARAALSRAEVLPLAAILPRIEAELDARVIEVEFESEDGRHLYEFELIRADGRLIEAEVDAATGAILAVEADGEHD